MSVVWELPCKSQEFEAAPSLVQQGDRVDLVYDYETPEGPYAQAKMTFFGVEAYAFTSFESCTAEQVVAYDRVLAIRPSPWLAELRKRRVHESILSTHYRVFFDEIGCYDIIASDFRAPES